MILAGTLIVSCILCRLTRHSFYGCRVFKDSRLNIHNLNCAVGGARTHIHTLFNARSIFELQRQINHTTNTYDCQ